MKALTLFAVLPLFATAAYAAPLTCSTDAHNNPAGATTSVTVNGGSNKTSVTVITRGGTAHYIMKKSFDVSVQHDGPELVIYSNKEEGFELDVNYQPLSDRGITGTLIRELEGARIESPVNCSMAR